MLETSQDLLYVVIAFCVLWLTIFICWLLYYFIMLLKQAYDVTKAVRMTIVKVDALVDGAKKRLESSASHLSLLVEAVGQLAQYVQARRAVPKTKKAKK